MQGLAGTTNGSIWYINWTDDTEDMESLRIVGGHKTQVNFPFIVDLLLEEKRVEPRTLRFRVDVITPRHFLNKMA